jgi:molybdopterin-binding protein
VNKAAERLDELAKGDASIHLELADGTELTGTIDAASAAQAEKGTRGPLSGKEFDASLEVTPHDLLRSAEEMLAEQKKASGGGRGGGTPPAPSGAAPPAAPPTPAPSAPPPAGPAPSAVHPPARPVHGESLESISFFKPEDLEALKPRPVGAYMEMHQVLSPERFRALLDEPRRELLAPRDPEADLAGETGERPKVRDIEPPESDAPPRPSLGPGQESEWIPATNSVRAEVWEALTPVSSLSAHVEGLVVRARREGKKVTIVSGYHRSADGVTRPEQRFAVDDAKFYGERYPDVHVIDTSKMTDAERSAVIDSIPGVVIVDTCYGACAKPSAPARPAGSPPLALPPGEPARTPPLPGTRETAPAPAAPPAPAPALAPAPTFKTLDQILTPDKAAFVDKSLQDAYTRYVIERTKAGDPAATPEEWVALTRGGPRERLETVLGPGYHFGTGGTGVERLIPLTEFPQPVSYMQARVEADVAAVTKNPAKLWERLNRLQTDGVTGGAVGSSLFNILKGNVGEILSGKIQETELAKVRRQHSDAALYNDVRARLVKPDGTLSEPVLFTDNVIASKRSGNLQLHSVFEVKAGSHGGQEATTQIFEWIEGHLTDGFEIQAGGEWYRYEPEATTGKRVVGLARAERHLIAVKGAEHLGQDSEFKTVREATRHALPQTAEEINYLTRLLIDRLIARHPQPAP